MTHPSDAHPSRADDVATVRDALERGEFGRTFNLSEAIQKYALASLGRLAAEPLADVEKLREESERPASYGRFDMMHLNKCIGYAIEAPNGWISSTVKTAIRDYRICFQQIENALQSEKARADRLEQQLAEMREALECQIKYCSNGMRHTKAAEALKSQPTNRKDCDITVHVGSYNMGLRDGAGDPEKAKRCLKGCGPLMDEPGFKEHREAAKARLNELAAKMKGGDATSKTDARPLKAEYSQPPRDKTDAEDQSRGGVRRVSDEDLTCMIEFMHETETIHEDLECLDVCIELRDARADIARKDKLLAEARDALEAFGRNPSAVSLSRCYAHLERQHAHTAARVHAALTEELGR